MCLDGCRTYPNSLNLKKGIGYKVFIQLYGRELFPRFKRDYDKPYDINRWYKADNKLILASNGNRYSSGFHIFLRKKDAERYANDKETVFKLKLKKVKFKKPTCSGYEWLYGSERPIVVAKEMLIPED